jgi:hypothetical protein
MVRYSQLLLISFLTLALSAPLLPGQDVGSHARIVRISYVEGAVQINDEPATVNSPVRESAVLRTGTDGLVEVQFEDGSAIRMASDTQITFAQLARLTSGEAITRTDLDDGEAEFLIPASSAGQFAVNTISKNVLFKAAGRYRMLSIKSSPLEIGVWKGEAIVRDRESGREVNVRKNETFTLNPTDPGQYDLENLLLADDLDQWSETRDQALNSAPATTYSYNSSSAYSPGLYSYAPAPFYLYGGAYNCSSWGFGWGSFGVSPVDCWNSGFNQPWFFLPPTNIVVVPGRGVLPHRPPHIRPPTVPAVAVAVAEPSKEPVPVKPGVRTFRFDQGIQRVFNEDNFQRSVPRVENPASGEAVRPGNSHVVEPVVAPGRRSFGTTSSTGSTVIPTVAPPPHVPHSSTTATSAAAAASPRAPSPAPRPSSPAPSSGSHGFSGGSVSHSAPSPSHSGGGRH